MSEGTPSEVWLCGMTAYFEREVAGGGELTRYGVRVGGERIGAVCKMRVVDRVTYSGSRLGRDVAATRWRIVDDAHRTSFSTRAEAATTLVEDANL